MDVEDANTITAQENVKECQPIEESEPVDTNVGDHAGLHGCKYATGSSRKMIT